MTTPLTPGPSLRSPRSTETWRAVVAGGATALPRWSTVPAPDAAPPASAEVPDDLGAAVRTVATALGVEPETLLLAAHARVLGTLTGEGEILTALATGRTPRPCRLDVAVPSWRLLVAGAAAAVGAAHDSVDAGTEDTGDDTDAALAALRAEGTGLWPETVLDPDPTDGDRPLDVGVVLRVEWTGDAVRARYRPDALDAEAAARIAGYHVAALAHLVADPDADPAAGGLVGPEELRFLLDGLAGPERALPDRRPHEIVRDVAAARPDAIAVIRGERRWTYRDLDDASDRLARALLARGLQAEDIVAVVAERTPEWAVAVLGVLKSGGAYLPLEPHFPADRIATVLRRSGCPFVLGERGSTATLDEALRDRAAAGSDHGSSSPIGVLPSSRLPAPERILIDDALREEHPGVDAHTEVAADRLAYLYFTSGSTGEPKGAMCEHAGMLNHLYAKIDDLGVTEDTVVAQTAPQCFDISLWQLMAAWLVGGTTLLVEQETVLDVPSFVELITRRRVGVAQLVPSYLDVVVSYLEQQPTALPDLRCLAVTGEAVKKELVARWFAVRPDVPLVNAYGLTETSDDTNHEILRGVPDHERVPLGPAVANVRVYVVDEHLVPVPLGAPGEIVFSGVCVGRGYVNDPERTAAAFTSDPLRPGERLYRSGDHGRWLPDGKLDFLGRRDHQVKISGFRIEIGEIENTLLRAPGVRDAAVVVTDRPGRGKQLVGFYGAPEPIASDVLRETLAAALPVYMVPGVLHHREALPLTANGKIDRKTLTALAGELDVVEETHVDAPRTATERRLAAVWAPLLGVDEDAVGRRDHFFDRGGSSLLAVKMAVRLEKAVTLPEIARNPVLADLAALIDEKSAPVEQVADEVPTVGFAPSELTAP